MLTVRARRQVAWATFTLALALLIVRPIGGLALEAFSGNAQEVRRLTDIPRFWVTIRNTVVLGVSTTLIAGAIGVGLALAATRLPARLRGFLTIVPLLPLMLPTVAYVSGYTFLLSPTVGYVNQVLRRLPWWDHLASGPIDVYTPLWITLIPSFLFAAFIYVFVYSSVRDINGEIIAAAQVSGAGQARIVRTVILPLAKPAIAAGSGVVLLLALGQFTAPLMLGRGIGYDTLATEMFRVKESFPINFAKAAALGLPLIATGIVVVLAQKMIVGNPDKYVIHTGKGTRAPLSTTPWAAVPIVIYGAVTVLLPVLALARVATSGYWSGELSLDGMTLDPFRQILKDDLVTGALRNSLTASLLAVAITLPLGFLCAMCTLPRSSAPRIVRTAVDVLVLAPMAMPAVIMGFAVLSAYTGDPIQLYGTTTVIVISYVTIMLPFATRTQQSSLLMIGATYTEASMMCGAGPFRTAFKVVLPLIRRGVAAGAAVMVVLLFHEFSTSMMVRAARKHVMGSVVYYYWVQGSLPGVAALSLLMIAVTAVGVALAMSLGGRKALEAVGR